MGVETAIGAVFAFAGLAQQERGIREQRAGRRQRERLQELRAGRERRKQVRAGRQARAAAVARSSAQGTEESSVSVAAQAGIQSQVADNLKFLNTSQALTESVSRRSQRAADARGRAATLSTASNLSLELEDRGFSLFGD